ncbi:hypothetical protein KL935_005008 [Ogataea polymorpha]|uniref:U3 small nucleolar RNA-associated protein 14 n=2 Tax=Ogataea polymorpha TaxID=460523 RepID=A0A9P8PIQ7_9ASCO|nr:hypothetical protein KL935_005008 [Ogataea polymorpha]KAG7905344.1 hypothetical protein KL906_005199 [Ogataea polymorpha]KAG7930056.1 hypothetical protein KL934_005168 [Ogataea polymorpha]KAH3672562.1 hypothetical protein OGATHE_002207 [Ogataea polymorpha]
MAKKGGKVKNRALNALEIAEAEQSSFSDIGSESEGDNQKFKSGILTVDGEDFEDEELDSDDALNSEDDYDVLNSKFSQTIRDKDEADEGYDSIDESELIPLSEVWARDDEELKRSGGKELVLDENLVSDESSSEESEDSEEEDVFEDLEDEENELSTVKSQLRSKDSSKAHKTLINDKTEENAFRVPATGQKLSLAEMMGDIDTEKPLLLSESSAPEPLAVPLPQSIQKRHERRAAYEIQKEEVEKWTDSIQANRRAEVLKFPSKDGVQHNQASSFQPADVPLTSLDKKLDGLLEQSNIESKKAEDLFENIETAKLSKEEMAKRTRELRLMRELMYRGQKDAKRLKKIKSKTYRQKLRKEKQRNKELVEGSDVEDEDADYKRAAERMSLKHKNTSEWAKSMIKSGMSKDKESRDELEEMLRQGEKLRQKQLGYDEGESETDERDAVDIAAEQIIDDTERAKLGKGLMAMDFMKRAEERERIENQRLAAQLQYGDESDEEQVANEVKNAGRRVYTPGAAATTEQWKIVEQRAKKEAAEDQEKSLENRLKAKNAPKQNNKGEESNPWLAEAEPTRGQKARVVDANSSRVQKNAAKIKKRTRKEAELDVEITIGDTLDDEHEGEGDREQDIHVFQQKDLIKQAFAGDDVVTEFEQEKHEVEELEGDKEIDLTLPGWGDWAGGNYKKKKKIVKTINGVVPSDKRKDKNKKGVIVNERVNKKNAKYQAGSVPYPFETMEQYERSLRQPIGQEWTSREIHQKLTMPKVIAKHGSVIAPMKKE